MKLTLRVLALVCAMVAPVTAFAQNDAVPAADPSTDPAAAIADPDPAPVSTGDPFEDAVRAFQGGGYVETETFLQAIAATGDERALPLIEAVEAGQLYILDSEMRAVLAEEAETPDMMALTDPVTEEALAEVPEDTLSLVRVNNRIRRAIQAARGSLTLLSDNPRTRVQAANTVFASRDVTTVETLRDAIAQEQNPRVMKKLREAEAAIVLDEGADDAEMLAAIEIVRGRGDRAALTFLNQTAQSAEGDVRTAAETAARAVDERLRTLNIVQNAWYGVSLGSVLLLAATGLAITFGVMGVINMAHGELVMLGAYTTYLVQQMFVAYLPGAIDFALIVAVPAAFLVAGGMGVAMERGVIRFLYGRPLETLLATWGVSLILQQLMRNLFGPSNVLVSTPPWMSGTVQVVPGLDLTLNRIAIVLFTLVVFAGLMMVIKRTPFGLRMRAVTQNRRMAGSVGIRSNWIDAITFGLGAGVAGMAGVAISQIDNVSPNLGQAYIIDSFLVVVFGGVGNLWGAFVGALSLGVANKFLEPFAGAVLAKILILVAVILFIQRRPRGMFALRGRAVEA
jgi:urea transport system permease protein